MKEISEVALLMGYKDASPIRKLIKAGKLKAIKFGNTWGMTPHQIKMAIKWRLNNGKHLSDWDR